MNYKSVASLVQGIVGKLRERRVDYDKIQKLSAGRLGEWRTQDKQK